MTNFGAGVYLLTLVWCITLMLCWITVRTGHYIGKVAVVVSVVITGVVLALPKHVVNESRANDKVVMFKYAVFSILLVSALFIGFFGTCQVCCAPVEPRKIRNFGTN